MKTLRFQSLKHKPCHQNFFIKFIQLKNRSKIVRQEMPGDRKCAAFLAATPAVRVPSQDGKLY